MMGVLSIAATLSQAYPEPRSTPLAPAWLVLPMAAVVMLLLAGHCQAIQRVPMPDSRKRIRTAWQLRRFVAGIPGALGQALKKSETYAVTEILMRGSFIPKSWA